MPFTLVLAALAAYLLLYAPGHYLLRLDDAPVRRGSLLFREVLLSACCTSWIGFVLAELSIYSLPALLGSMGGIALTAAALGRRRSAGRYAARDAAGIAALLFAWWWLSPPLDTRILSADSAGYLAAGVNLSRHGSLIFQDPTIPLLPQPLKYALFPSVTETPWQPPYLRLLGSLILRGMDGTEVLPAFHHLITVWVAIFHGIAGSAAAQWAIILFGGLSLWAMVEVASLLCGGLTAVFFFALLSLSAVQGWYSRFLMPEIPGQYFLWGGIACVALWSGSQRRSDAVLAGVAFGVAGLMRTENAVFTGAALIAALAFVGGHLRGQRWWLLACAAGLWLHAFAHLLVFRTHYIRILQSLVPDGAAVLTGASWVRVTILAAVVAGLLLWQFRAGFAALRRTLPWMLVAGAVGLWAEWQHRWSGFGLLVDYIGVPTVIAGVVGLGLFAGRVRAEDTAARVVCALAALALLQFLVAPHATPVPIWVIRRAATLGLPMLCFGAAFLCATAVRRRRRVAAALVLAVVIAGQLKPFNQLRWTPYYEGGLAHVRAVAGMVPPGSVLLYDTPLTAWGLAQGLWAEHDTPAYLLSRFHPMLILQVLRALGETPVYWVAEGRWAPPRPFGLVPQRVGTYSFTMLTPTLDEKTEAGMSSRWNPTIAVYRFVPPGA